VSRVARQIAASGEYTQRVPEPLGHDEAAVTARTVNAMLERLAALIEHERAFSLAAAHELRTPLSVLLARTQLGLESRTLEEAKASLHRSERSVRELVTLVDGLLSLARSGEIPVRLAADLSDVALRALESFEHGLPAKADLDLQGSPVLGDPLALQLAVRNLLENAGKYGRGQLWLSTGGDLQHSWLSVMDDGPGISLPDRARLLRPFQQLDLQSGGAGLGLALVQTVAQRHGAEVRLEHPPDGRFTVRLIFPAAPLPSQESR
jgi:signal transduction histidine kinase